MGSYKEIDKSVEDRKMKIEAIEKMESIILIVHVIHFAYLYF